MLLVCGLSLSGTARGISKAVKVGIRYSLYSQNSAGCVIRTGLMTTMMLLREVKQSALGNQERNADAINQGMPSKLHPSPSPS